MKIKQKLSQSRRDFRAIYICEHCNHEYEAGGYDDAHFHQNVIPDFKCPVCKKTSPETYKPNETKYPEGFVI